MSVDRFDQTIVMVTHDPVAAAYTDRVVFLADGQVVDELRESHGRSRAREDATREPRGDRPDVGWLTMWRMSLRNLLARKLRLAMSAFAIVLGVAFVAGSFVFTDSLGSAFDGIVKGNDGGRRGDAPAGHRRPQLRDRCAHPAGRADRTALRVSSLRPPPVAGTDAGPRASSSSVPTVSSSAATGHPVSRFNYNEHDRHHRCP